jgi:hypothetical protein
MEGIKVVLRQQIKMAPCYLFLLFLVLYWQLKRSISQWQWWLTGPCCEAIVTHAAKSFSFWFSFLFLFSFSFSTVASPSHYCTHSLQWPLSNYHTHTSDPLLWWLTGGGYPRGRVIEIYGPESSGKTTLALHAVAEIQKTGGRHSKMDGMSEVVIDNTCDISTVKLNSSLTYGGVGVDKRLLIK